MPKGTIGDLCPDCQSPFIAGNDGGGYCKPCYIIWAEANKGKTKPPTEKNNGLTEKDIDRMTRHGLLVAHIGAGKTLSVELSKQIKREAFFIKNGDFIGKTDEEIAEDV